MLAKTGCCIVVLIASCAGYAFAQAPAAPEPPETVPAPVPALPSQPPNLNNTAVIQPPSIPQLDKIYENRLYRIAIKYPSAWNVRDIATGKEKQKADKFWVAFGGEPITVNIHSQKLASTTNAVVFAKHNTYINNWAKKMIGGSPWFYTQSGTPENRNVIHRAIMILKGRAIMMNCVDKSGGPTAASGALFDAMLASLQNWNAPPANKQKSNQNTELNSRFPLRQLAPNALRRRPSE